MKYRYDMMGADAAGVRAHPQTVIASFARDAYAMAPVPWAECWLFRTREPIERLPPYIALMPEHERGPMFVTSGPKPESTLLDAEFAQLAHLSVRAWDPGREFTVHDPGLPQIPIVPTPHDRFHAALSRFTQSAEELAALSGGFPYQEMNALIAAIETAGPAPDLVCPACQGTGLDASAQLECESCHGTGQRHECKFPKAHGGRSG